MKIRLRLTVHGGISSRPYLAGQENTDQSNGKNPAQAAVNLNASLAYRLCAINEEFYKPR